jgi:hypothetical protein
MTWYTIDFDYDEHGRAHWHMRIKWWHPGFWLAGYKTLRESGSGILTSLWFTVILAWQMRR